jgi:UPF0716 family protein affecting phage T7 exclusion
VRRPELLIDAGVAVIVAAVVLVLSPGIAFTAIVALVAIAVCAATFAVGLRSRRQRRQRLFASAPRRRR